MPYSKNRDRIEAHPKAGTKEKLKAQAEKAGKSLNAHVSEILEKAVK